MFWSGYSTYDNLSSINTYEIFVNIYYHTRISNWRSYRKVTIVTSILMCTFHDAGFACMDSYTTKRGRRSTELIDINLIFSVARFSQSKALRHCDYPKQLALRIQQTCLESAGLLPGRWGRYRMKGSLRGRYSRHGR